MEQQDLGALWQAATRIAWAGGRRTLGYFQGAVAPDRKADGTPVTVADRETEALMRGLIHESFPDHGVVGEELGVEQGSAPVRWILDPIDGTKTFVAGVPLYGTLVGVEVEGAPVVGVIYMPALDEMVSAATGLGCWWNGRRCSVSTTAALPDALLNATDLDEVRRRLGAGYDALQGAVRTQRTWADCYAYVLVATGRAEVALDAAMDIWDAAALLPIVEEAGGRLSAWSGERTVDGGDAVATNGILHDAVLAHLTGAR